MREFTDQDILRVGLEIMDEVHAFCVEHHLIYFLAYGTLLGAIRHNGYIPWDDDIDILMPRKDYEYFISHFDNDHYGVISIENNKHYPLSYAKAYDKKSKKIEIARSFSKIDIGFNIDVIPMDCVSSEEEYIKLRKKSKGLALKARFGIVKVNPKESLKQFIKFFITLPLGWGNHRRAVKLDRYFRKHHKGEDKLYGVNIIYDGYDINYCFPINWVEEVKLKEFEGREYYVPTHYDEILKIMFADYMKFPPKEEQVTHHGFKVYFRD